MDFSAKESLRNEFAELMREGLVTPNQVIKALRIIYLIREDAESAHVFEDALRHAVLRTISQGSPYSMALAELALKTSEMQFARWCS